MAGGNGKATRRGKRGRNANAKDNAKKSPSRFMDKKWWRKGPVPDFITKRLQDEVTIVPDYEIEHQGHAGGRTHFVVLRTLGAKLEDVFGDGGGEHFTPRLGIFTPDAACAEDQFSTSLRDNGSLSSHTPTRALTWQCDMASEPASQCPEVGAVQAEFQTHALLTKTSRCINSLPESGHRGIIRIRLSEQQLYAPVHVEIFSIGPTKAIHATPGADCNSVWIRTENNVRVFVRRRTRTDKKNSVVTAARISSKAAAAPSDAVSPQAKAPCPTNGSSSSSSSSSSSRNTKTSSSSPQEGGDDRAQWSWNWTEVPRRELDASEAAADVKGEDAPQTGRTPDEGGGADLARNEGAIDDTSENDEEGRSSSRFRVATTNTVNESRCSFWESNQFFDISPIAFDHSSGSIWIETHTNNYTKFKINWML
eukprot:jgi/Bigna1/78112/fgenesh1_pg.52_\